MTKFCSTFHEILAFKQNNALKQEVGHCDLILLWIFFFTLIILKNQGAIQNFSQIYQVVQQEKLILVVELFLAKAAIFDSQAA